MWYDIAWLQLPKNVNSRKQLLVGYIVQHIEIHNFENNSYGIFINTVSMSILLNLASWNSCIKTQCILMVIVEYLRIEKRLLYNQQLLASPLVDLMPVNFVPTMNINVSRCESRIKYVQQTPLKRKFPFHKWQ